MKTNSRSRQTGLSIPLAIFVLVIIAMLGAAMVNILNLGQESVAREVVSMRALMAAESGAERGLNTVLEGGAACTGDLSVAPTDLDNLSWSPWTIAAPGLAGCTAVVSCGQINIAGTAYYSFRSEGECGPAGDRAHRVIQVQAKD